VEIKEPRQIRHHIEKFYKDLFSAEERGRINPGDNFWGGGGQYTILRRGY
jgi:hypothetical protein